MKMLTETNISAHLFFSIQPHVVLLLCVVFLTAGVASCLCPQVQTKLARFGLRWPAMSRLCKRSWAHLSLKTGQRITDCFHYFCTTDHHQCCHHPHFSLSVLKTIQGGKLCKMIRHQFHTYFAKFSFCNSATVHRLNRNTTYTGCEVCRRRMQRREQRAQHVVRQRHPAAAAWNQDHTSTSAEEFFLWLWKLPLDVSFSSIPHQIYRNELLMLLPACFGTNYPLVY